ncbi:hypothetical protein SADUNF_Sadunf05G0005200 [Salix dunnii]|uniref:Uncharacterized protein n=1 Tax=Salix dunnii TaxID=1413687 RepID=A0A835K334_9ROSI|nr:hypothetical protein SADUNF_Sadunf05G0005200 [Salix dunnii]
MVLRSAIIKTKEIVLDLSFNPFNDDSILSCLTGLLSLKSLDLSANRLEGSAGFNGFEVLSSRLKKLENLHLSGNQYNDSIFSSLTGFSSLKSLDLSRNNLIGSTSTNASQFRTMWRLRKLENLDLSFNKLNDNVLSILSGLSSLKSLDLSYNKLTGSSINGLEIVSSQLRKLENLDLSYNKLNDKVLSNICGFPSLKPLNLSGNILLRSTTISGLRKLEVLSLDKLTIIGSTMLQSLGALPSLKTLSVQETTLTRASLSQGWWCELKNLEQLDLSGNNLEGSVPECLGNLSSLQLLDFTTLTFLDLSKNNLGGQLPALVVNSTTLNYLCLSFNNFRGQIADFPTPVKKKWAALGLSNNQFSGMLPRWFANSTRLRTLDLSRNHFKGPIPIDFCKLDGLKYLDLSENKLFGSIPSCFNPPNITHVHLSRNRLSGPLTYGFHNSSSLVTLDLRDNSFTGAIPNWFGNLSTLNVLLLRANHFDGEFPVQLCLLEQLSILDVSQNQLSGPLPSCLGNLTFKESSKKAVVYLGIVFSSRSIGKAYYETMGPPLVESIYNLDSSYLPITIEEVVPKFCFAILALWTIICTKFYELSSPALKIDCYGLSVNRDINAAIKWKQHSSKSQQLNGNNTAADQRQLIETNQQQIIGVNSSNSDQSKQDIQQLIGNK